MISPGTVSGRASLTCLHFVNERQHWNSTNRRGHFARPPGVVAETVVEVGGGAGFAGGVLTAFAGAMGEVCRSAGCCMGSRATLPASGRR
jgi:hypothetical protein